MRLSLSHQILIHSSISVLAIVGLYFLSVRMNNQKNGFIRLFPPHILQYQADKDLGSSGFYIAGATNSHLFLGNNNAPAEVTMTDYELKDLQKVILKFPSNTSLHYLQTEIDSPFIYSSDGFRPAISRGTISNTQMNLLETDKTQFSLFVPLSPNSFALRTFDVNDKENRLSKETLTFPIKMDNYPVLQKQQDGLFSTDGMFLYDRLATRLIYLYYYRNEFLCLDTTLSVLYHGHTIDTNAHAKLTVTYIPEERMYTLSSPPQTVNISSALNNRFLAR